MRHVLGAAFEHEHGCSPGGSIFTLDQGIYRLNKGLSGAAPERALMGLSGLAYIDQQEMLKAACRVGNLNSQQVNASLMRLYSQYAMEWQTIRPTIGILPTSTFSDYSKNQEALTI